MSDRKPGNCVVRTIKEIGRVGCHLTSFAWITGAKVRKHFKAI
jgi:hypothetical protein